MKRELTKGTLVVENSGALGDYSGVEISYVSPSGISTCLAVVEEDNTSKDFVVMTRLYNKEEEPCVIEKVKDLLNKEDEFLISLKREIIEYAENRGYDDIDERVISDICDIYMDCQEWSEDGDRLTGWTLEEISDFLRHSSEVDECLEKSKITYLVEDLFKTLEKANELRSKLNEYVYTDDGFDALDAAFSNEIEEDELISVLLNETE